MSEAYLCDGCDELKEGHPYRWTSLRNPPETKGESRDYCKECWEKREAAA